MTADGVTVFKHGIIPYQELLGNYDHAACRQFVLGELYHTKSY